MSRTPALIASTISLLLLWCPASQASSLLEETQVVLSQAAESDGVAVSPDDEHVYVAVRGVDARIAVFDRDTTTEELTPLQLVENGVGGLTALADPYFVRVTPDGLGVLATSRSNDAVVAFVRDPATGLLTFAGEVVNGSGGVVDLELPSEVTVSPDSRHVYVACVAGDAVVILSRDLVTGDIAYVDAETFGGPPGLDAPQTVSVSPNGADVYVGSDNALQHYTRNVTSGELTHVQAYASIDRVLHLGMDPSGTTLYALASGWIWSFDRDVGTGALTTTSATSLGGSPPFFADARSLAVFPDYVYVAADGISLPGPAIVRFERDPGTDVLLNKSQVGTEPEFSSPSNQGYLASPNNGNALISVVNDVSARVDLVRSHVIDPGTGDLSLTAFGSLGPVGSAFVESAALSPDGAHLYTVNNISGRVSALSTYTRDAITGDLALVQSLTDLLLGAIGLDNPTGVAVSPDGKHVYVSSETNDTVTVFDRAAGTGLVSLSSQVEDGVGGVSGLDGAEEVVVSPDGLHVYVASDDGSALAGFSRDGTTGALTFLEAHIDGVSGADGLLFASHVAMSPDGRNLYVTAPGESAISVWDRDPATGLLTLVEVLREGLDGIGGITFTYRIVVSPDGSHVYANTIPALTQFARDPATGTLTQQRVYEQGKGGWPEAAFFVNPSHLIVISPDGENLYTGFVTAARDPLTGDLSFIRHEPDGGGFLAVSADSQFIYANAVLDMQVYTPGFSGCDPAPLVGCETAAKTKITLKDSTVPKKQKLVWSWINGPPADVTDFDPMDVKDYGFCLYDESGGTPQLVFEALIPAGGDCRKNNASSPKDCWSVSSSKVKYSDTWLSPDGILQAQFFPHLAPKSRIKIKGKGGDLPLDGLPFGLPLRAQVQDVAGGCWEALYGSATKNDATTFRAKTP